MSCYILINRIKVQNANAIAGFTWGFPAITHFLGFTHKLSRKLSHPESAYNDISLNGCTVVCHKHHVHTYKSSSGYQFTQSRNPPYLASHDKSATPPIVEEGKMNLTVSLLIGCEGNIGNRHYEFIQWLRRNCFLQRLAGGTILDIDKIEVIGDDNANLRLIKRRLLPGFVLMDRSQYLKEHFESLEQSQPDVELLDAWLDFSTLQYKARPKSDFIDDHFYQLAKSDDGSQSEAHVKCWLKHLDNPYDQEQIPEILKLYFDQLRADSSNKKLLRQWKSYCNPTENTDADWNYMPKPRQGYLVPIMTGYKAISQLYDNSEVANTRDNETPVCFVESVHSVGEWLSVHRFKNMEQMADSLWHYHYEKDEQASDNAIEQFGWYLCKQPHSVEENSVAETIYENPEDDFS